MKKLLLILSLLSITALSAENLKPWAAALKNLNTQERNVIVNKGTERPYTGKYLNNKEIGVYTCKVCDVPLYKSDDKFNSHCGWPSFDDEIKGAIKHKTDKDGHRTEILCAKCDAHLGHVFKGEGMTAKNTRHCVNSISLNFKDKDAKKEKKDDGLKHAYFAGGCFWGIEYLFEKTNGVTNAISGYMGGTIPNPDYRSICTGTTGHFEVVEINYDNNIINFDELVMFFFEIHDFTQINGQGPDIGPQYLSAIFYNNQDEKELCEDIIKELKTKGYKVATKLISTLNTPFFKAEDYHQDYYTKTGKIPYCHKYKKVF
jgi:peptide methionine sulfoxide reductase msrA/msrB